MLAEIQETFVNDNNYLENELRFSMIKIKANNDQVAIGTFEL